jgi:hypothetical protein
MSKIIKVEVYGGFHNTMRVLNLNLKKDEKNGGVIISKGQRAKIAKHICGYSDCMCGLRDIKVDGVSGSDFNYAMSESRF